jgi:hypothetical protein
MKAKTVVNTLIKNSTKAVFPFEDENILNAFFFCFYSGGHSGRSAAYND